MSVPFISLLSSKQNFNDFLGYFDKHYNSVGKYREPNYTALINLFRSSPDPHHYLTSITGNILNMNRFYNCLGNEFGMNKRAAVLVAQPIMLTSISSNMPLITQICHFRMDSPSLNSNMDRLFATVDLLFNNLSVMSSSSRLVGVSKALHFLLPDLIMPIDGENVMQFIYGRKSIPGSLDKQIATFKDIFKKYLGLVRSLGLSINNSNGNWWNVSVPKRIDNAISGFWREYYSYIDRNDVTGCTTWISRLFKRLPS